MTPDNEITLRPAMSFAILKILPLLLLSLAFVALAWAFSPFFLSPAFSALGMSWYHLLYIRSCSYLITPAEIRASRGIFFKRTDYLEMYRIKDYVVTRPILMQLFRLMNVTLKSTDIENPVLQMPGIPLSDIIDTIRDYVQEARKTNNIYEIN